VTSTKEDVTSTKRELTLPNERFEEVYRADARRLWWALVAFTGDRELASDAVAEAFTQGLNRGEAIRAPAAWVKRAAFRIAAGEMRRRAMESHQATETGYEMPEPALDVVRALASLPPNQRACAVLHYYLDLPITEIARVINIAPPTVGVHLYRARKRLRALLEETS
jgi:RNA polymerase sigma-70 factor (ECF subfamily)